MHGGCEETLPGSPELMSRVQNPQNRRGDPGKHSIASAAGERLGSVSKSRRHHTEASAVAVVLDPLTEEGEACGGEEVKGGEALPHSHTWGEGEPRGGGERRLNPGEEKEEEPGEEKEEEARSCRDACEGNNGGHFSREEAEEEEGGALLNPCRCDGSVRYTHQTCLLKWISERAAGPVNSAATASASSPSTPRTPGSISWLLWSALSPQAVWQRRDVLFQICYGMYSFMDLVCVGLIVHEGAAVYSVFLRWRAVNLHWDVQSYNKAKDLEETSTGQSALSPRTLWLPLTTFAPDGPYAPAPSWRSSHGAASVWGPFATVWGPETP
ncbi:hypothetical protein F7725_010976 [Dissostichus mawsoni]|uniref:RING-type E3 ubiquitin transferase n=1 Tax=Dissostichus mawsoni TaxID=36200 RepID=A0A7J5Z7N5_DISMA|nr:hypothetical protein F7725_010976 [Dissostichus mawsoni]